MTAVLITILICLTALLLEERACRTYMEALRLRGASLAVKAEKDPIPADLMSLAARESEGWARDQFLASIRELYEQTGDWAQVRARLTQFTLEV